MAVGDTGMSAATIAVAEAAAAVAGQSTFLVLFHF